MRNNVLLYFVLIIVLALYEAAEMIMVSNVQVEMESGGSTRMYIFTLTLLCLSFVFNKLSAKSYLTIPLVALFSGICFLELLQNLGKTSVFGLIQSFSTALLPFFVFCYFFKESKTIRYNVFITGIIIAYVIILYAFVESYTLRMLYSKSDYIRIGESYVFYFLLPFFLIESKNVVKIVSILFVTVIMIISLKRGGIISFAAGMLVYYLIQTHNVSGKSLIKVFLSSLFILLALYFIFTSYMQENFDLLLERITNIEDDQGSSRLPVYTFTWQMIVNSDFLHLIFGHGWNMVLQDSPLGFSAHNDFLEVIYDFGIIGFILYLGLYYKLYKYTIKLIRKHSVIAAPFAYSVTIFTVNSLVSHVIIYTFNMIAFTAVWGYLLGKDYNFVKKGSNIF